MGPVGPTWRGRLRGPGGRALCLLATLACGAVAVAAPPRPPENVSARDRPNDAGQAILLQWALSPDDGEARLIGEYQIIRSDENGADEHVVGTVPRLVRAFADISCVPGQAYLYRVRAIGVDGEGSAVAEIAQPVRSVRQWFDFTRAWFGVILLAVCAMVLGWTLAARRGRALYVREIAGLKAIDEAVGRATEMGRPCLFVPGSQDLNEIGTVAGINVLSHVARKAAEYDATVVVPTSRSLVMTAARETVQAACLAADRPEAFDENTVYYVTDEQFAYVAHVTGYMVRERPAACFYAGVFYAESLLLAETGSFVGALQIAGTSETSQLPFLVAACDYTLIGEELFAASAYLSGEPEQLGSLKGQDAGKLLAGALLVAGCLLATLVAFFPQLEMPQRVLRFLTVSVLGGQG